MTDNRSVSPAADAATTDSAESEFRDKPEDEEPAGSDPLASHVSDVDSAGPGIQGESEGTQSGGRLVSISLHKLLICTVIGALVVAVVVLAWLYVGAERKLDAHARQAENDRRAEQVALDYAVNAAAMDFQDLDAWKVKLVAGTSPELNEKLSGAAESMEQILVPLQWASTASPLVAKVRSHADGAYVVDSFVSVLTKTAQAPDSLQSTATYCITIDSNKDWQISEVRGVGAVVEQN